MMLLLIEDDLSLGSQIKESLEREGFSVQWAKSLSEAKDKKAEDFDLFLLDWMLPDGQGIDLLKEIRNSGLNIPVIFLTSRSDLVDRVLGLESGANDYMVKPFDIRELVARIRVQTRKASPSSKPKDEMISLGDIEISPLQRSISLCGTRVELTKMEYELVYFMANNPNQPFTRDELLDRVWGFDNFPNSRTVDTHVLQVRQKLGQDLIETVRGVGYLLRTPQQNPDKGLT